MRPPPIARSKKLQAQILAAWENVPVGTAVVLTRDDGTELRTATRSSPWMLGGHTAVVMVDGIAGGYALERLRLADSERASPAVVPPPVVSLAWPSPGSLVFDDRLLRRSDLTLLALLATVDAGPDVQDEDAQMCVALIVRDPRLGAAHLTGELRQAWFAACGVSDAARDVAPEGGLSEVAVKVPRWLKGELRQAWFAAYRYRVSDAARDPASEGGLSEVADEVAGWLESRRLLRIRVLRPTPSGAWRVDREELSAVNSTGSPLPRPLVERARFLWSLSLRTRDLLL